MIKATAVVLSFMIMFSGVCFAQPGEEQSEKRNAVPEQLVGKAVVPGFEDVRAFGDVVSPSFQHDLIQSIKDEPEGMFPLNPDGTKDYAIIGISGGGANGAYGAGVMNGWTAAGTRPEFKIVTGISTGALIAPFVFLGPSYDNQMKEMYTTVSTEDIMKNKALFSVNSANSLADNKGLKKLVEANVTEDILSAIAAEHKKGKRLYVGTTNLDAQRLIVWDMGKIALAGDKKALDLFRDVLVASAAIPIVFPPMYIDVEADGEKYEEIHVDGGTVTQVVALVGMLNGLRDIAQKEGVKGPKLNVSFYFIMNGYFAPHWRRVRNNIPSIAETAMDTLIKAQGMGDVYRIYTLLEARGIDFNLAYIPGDHVSKSDELFDQEEMVGLFNLGFDSAQGGKAWNKKPPFMENVKLPGSLDDTKS